MMTRLDYAALNPAALSAMLAAKSKMPAIAPGLRALIELRVSQINACHYCIDLHTKEAAAAGESPARIAAQTQPLNKASASAAFTPAECAAFAWAEAMTRLSDAGVPDRLFEDLRLHYSDAQVADLTYIIAQMNAWNRLAVAMGHEAD